MTFLMIYSGMMLSYVVYAFFDAMLTTTRFPAVADRQLPDSDSNKTGSI